MSAELWAILNDKIALRPIGDRILVQVDPFKSGFECKTCNGVGHTDEVCGNCKGKKFEEVGEFIQPCRACSVGISGARKSHGFKLCPDCHGKQATIIIPEDAEKPPTTGKVLAIGLQVTEFKVGTRVLFSNYTGTRLDIAGLDLRVMKQHDVFCEVKGYDDKSAEEKEYTELSDVGISVGRQP